MGRPTKLTEARHKAIVKAIREGNFAQVAAAAHGITEQTYYNWLTRGQADLDSGDPERESSIFAKFFEAIKQAEAEAEIKMMRELQRDEKWQRRAWWLERRFPRRWGQKQSLEVSGPEGRPIEVNAQAELESFLHDRREAIREAQAALAEAEAE